jgi:small-conductance mechanosensitive channel
MRLVAMYYLQVITNFSRANSKLLEADFHLHNQDIFLVNKITEDVVAYLRTHPQVETQRATPMCYLKNMGHWGPEISIMCTINFGVRFPCPRKVCIMNVECGQMDYYHSRGLSIPIKRIVIFLPHLPRVIPTFVKTSS